MLSLENLGIKYTLGFNPKGGKTFGGKNGEKLITFFPLFSSVNTPDFSPDPACQTKGVSEISGCLKVPYEYTKQLWLAIIYD